MDIQEEYLVDNVLSEKIYRIFQHIEDKIKENGDISQFKEDVLYVIHFLLERQLKPKQLTGTEMVVKQREYMLFKEKEKKDEEYIRTLKCELDKKDNIINDMAEDIEEHMSEEVYNFLYICDKCKSNNEECHGDYCKETIIDHFTNKYEEGKT